MTLRLRDYLYVFVQFLLFFVYLMEADQNPLALPNLLRYLALGIGVIGAVVMGLALLQLNRSLSPFPTPKQDGELIETGLYRYIRHPIYTGILLMGFGYAVFAGSGFKLLIMLGLWLLFYFKSGYEEARLLEKYADYASYRERTGRFWPKF